MNFNFKRKEIDMAEKKTNTITINDKEEE